MPYMKLLFVRVDVCCQLISDSTLRMALLLLVLCFILANTNDEHTKNGVLGGYYLSSYAILFLGTFTGYPCLVTFEYIFGNKNTICFSYKLNVYDTVD